MKPEIIYFSKDNWVEKSATYLQKIILEKSALNDRCNVMLTGGSSAERVMKAWGMLPDIAQLHNVDFFFGDERCVQPEDMESNFGLAMRTLFQFGIPKGCRVHRIEAESRDTDLAAKYYEELLPDRIDLLLLGMGADGHIASLFPGSFALHETRKVVAITGPKTPSQRITITPIIIDKADTVVILASGKEKQKAFRDAQCSLISAENCPARLVNHAIWLIDFDQIN